MFQILLAGVWVVVPADPLVEVKEGLGLWQQVQSERCLSGIGMASERCWEILEVNLAVVLLMGPSHNNNPTSPLGHTWDWRQGHPCYSRITVGYVRSTTARN